MHIRSFRIGSAMFAVGIVFVLALRMEWINPVAWFLTPEEPPHAIEQPLTPLPAGTPLASAGSEHRFVVLYQLDRNLGVSPAAKVLRQSGLLERATADLSGQLALPQDVIVRVKACGFINAYYDRSDQSITLCDELFYAMTELFAPRYPDADSFRDAVLGSTMFFLMHEVGHALVDLYDLPVLASEENAVDALATYLLAANGGAGMAYRGAESFAYWAEVRHPNSGFAFWDEHAVHEQRFYNITCWLFGSDPGRFVFVVGYGMLPVERAERCPDEYAQLRQSVRTLLGPYLRG